MNTGERFDMLYFMKPLQEIKTDISDWKPFIKNHWFRKNFVFFAYGLQVLLLIFSIAFGVWNFSNAFFKAGLFICTYIIHELLHVIVVYNAGDISITHSGLFLWITSGAVLGKLRFFIFMSLPVISLTFLPAILHIFLSGEGKSIAAYIAWVNAIIAGADIINSILIAVKPNNAQFYRGYYKTASSLPD